MTDEEKAAMVYEYLFETDLDGNSRARDLEALLRGVHAASFVGRAILWVCGFITAVVAAFAVFGGKS